MSIFNKLKAALNKTTSGFTKIKEIFTTRKIDANTLDELEEELLKMDFGVQATNSILKILKDKRIGKDEEEKNFTNHLKDILVEKMTHSQKPLNLEDGKLNVLLFCGVNGSGKTTSIGKLANIYKKKGKKISIAACDTFRSAAVEQLEVWAKRSDSMFIKGSEKGDAASIAYEAIQISIKENMDILIIDTAGRLQNQHNLMEELNKITKVIKKFSEISFQNIVIVLDATIGQNSLIQVEKFNDLIGITGIIFTKLDGTAKGGAIIGISEKFSLPIHYISIGESIDDIAEFNSREFIEAMIG